MHRKYAMHGEHHQSEDDSGRDSQDILYPLEEADVAEGQRLTDVTEGQGLTNADGQVPSLAKETKSPEVRIPDLNLQVVHVLLFY